MAFFFDPNHAFTGHVDDSLNQFDNHHSPLGGTDVHGNYGTHHDASHGFLGTSEHHANGSMSHFDPTHRLMGTTEHHAGTTYHYDPSHQLTGTEQQFGGHTYSYDAAHRLTGMSDAQFDALRTDLSSAFRRLF